MNGYSNQGLNTLVVNGKERSYQIRLPSNEIEPSEGYPLIIALHGFGGNARTIETVSNLTEICEKEDIIVVYPNGYAKQKNAYFYSWNAGFCCGDAYDNNSNDVQFIDQLITEIKEKNTINDQKIGVTGISNGGMLTHKIGTELGHKLSVIFPISASIGGWRTETSSFETLTDTPTQVNVVLFHGTADRYVPYNGGLSKGNMYKLLSVEESVNYWITHNQCSPFPEKSSNETQNVIKETYSGGISETAVTLYTLVDGMHAWPGGTKGPTRNEHPFKKQDCDASQLIVDYMLKL